MYLKEIYHTKKVFDEKICNDIIAKGESATIKKSEIKDGDNSNRSSLVSWLNNETIPELTKFVNLANEENNWNFLLREFEPLQYSIYQVGDYYDWHVDSHTTPYDNGLIRKLSFTLCLNEDYEGGELKFSTPHPDSNKNLVDILKPKTGTMITFPSHIWHKVEPVTKGIRKSLVGWIVGKPFA